MRRGDKGSYTANILFVSTASVLYFFSWKLQFLSPLLSRLTLPYTSTHELQMKPCKLYILQWVEQIIHEATIQSLQITIIITLTETRHGNYKPKGH